MYLYDYLRVMTPYHSSRNKLTLGIWYSYNTLYTYRNVAFEVNAMYDIYYEIPHDYQQALPEFRVQSDSYPGPVETTVESKSATWSAPVGDLIKSSYTYYPNILPGPYFIKVRGEGRSRGTVGYAIISCGY